MSRARSPRRTPPHLLRAALAPLERAHDAGSDLLDAFGSVDEARRVLGAVRAAPEAVPEGLLEAVATRLGANPEHLARVGQLGYRLVAAIERRAADATDLLAAASSDRTTVTARDRRMGDSAANRNTVEGPAS